MLPLWSLTSSAINQRDEFTLIVVAAVAGSGADGRTVAAVMAAVTVARPSDYGTGPLSQACTFLRTWRDTQQANPAIYRAADKAHSSLVGGGATYGSGFVS